MSGALVQSGLAKIEWLNGLILCIRNSWKLALVRMASKVHVQSSVKVCIRICFGGMLCTWSSVMWCQSEFCFLLFRSSSTHKITAVVIVA
jgi:hypothetical protein